VYLDELHDLSDRMPADDSVRITSFTATPMPVGKEGKQNHAGAGRTEDRRDRCGPFNALVSAFEKDNPSGTVARAAAPLAKFYTGTGTQVLGAVTGASTASTRKGFIVKTQVNYRKPELFTRHPNFVRRSGVGACSASRVRPP